MPEAQPSDDLAQHSMASVAKTPLSGKNYTMYCNKSEQKGRTSHSEPSIEKKQ